MRALLSCLLLLVGSLARADAIADCARQASERFQVPPIVLVGVALTEGGWLGAEPRNENGTRDLGPMQINTIHLDELAAFGITYAQLRDNPCINFHVGAFLLRRHYRESGSWVTAIGWYHNKTPAIAAAYRLRVYEHLARLCGRGRAGEKGRGASGCGVTN